MPFESLACSLSVGLFFSAAPRRRGIAHLAVRRNRYRVRQRRLPRSAVQRRLWYDTRAPARTRTRTVRLGASPLSFVWTGSRSTGERRCPRVPGTGIRYRRSWTTVGDFFRQAATAHRRARMHDGDRPPCFAAPTPDGTRRRGRPAANRYFFSGSGAPGCLNGNVLNIDFAWFCICSCICTNMFFDCSM